MPDRKQLERWLDVERSGQDDAADQAFLSVFAGLPRIEPSPAFAEQAMASVLRWRARRRRLVATAWAAAALIVAAGGLGAWLFGPAIAPSVVKPVALGLSHATPWLVAYATEAMNLWWAIAGLATAIANALATPPTAGAIVGAELIGIFAFFALQRLVGAERSGEIEL
jgi:hypothetical protein